MIKTQVASTTMTSTGTTTPVDVSQIDGALPWSLVLEVRGLSDGCEARILVETSTDSFSTVNEETFFVPVGMIGRSHVLRRSWQSWELPAAIVGILDAQMRLNVARLAGASPSITMTSWIESGVQF